MAKINIMSVGPSGVGKSCIGNKLLGTNRKHPNYFKNQASAVSCTQDITTVVSDDGKFAYTDVPGIPDTELKNTKAFYNMIINEAKNPYFFVFGLNMRMDKGTKDRIRQCALLFNEVNKSTAIKILVLNDMKAWANPEKIAQDEDDYEEEKNKHDETRRKTQMKYEKNIKELTGIDFHCTAVLYDIDPMNKGNMKEALGALKIVLEPLKCQPSPHLRTFEDLSAEVINADKKQDYEQRLVKDQKRIIKMLEDEVRDLQVYVNRAKHVQEEGKKASQSILAGFLTLGGSWVGGKTVEAGAAATAEVLNIPLKIKEGELSRAQSKLDTKNLKAAVKEFKEQYKKFEELSKALEEKDDTNKTSA